MSPGKFRSLEWLAGAACNMLWRLSRGSLVACAVVAFHADAADLPLTRLESVSPAGAAAGAEVDLSIAGTDLEGVDALWFSHPGISAAFVKEKSFKVKVNADVQEGVYDVRAVGNHGASNPRAFVVDRMATVLKAGECSLAKPMDVLAPAAVFGTLAATGRDHYRVNAKRGERFTIRCMAREIDSKVSPVVTVLQDGRKVAASDKRCYVDFRAPVDGAFVVQVHDLSFAGGADYFYRLSIDRSPILEAVMPFALEPGKKNAVRLLGRGLPGSKPASIKGWDGTMLEVLETEIDVPALSGLNARADGCTVVGASGVPSFSYRFRCESGVSNAIELPVLAGSLLVGTDPISASLSGSGAKSGALRLPSVPSVASGFFTSGFAGSRVEFDARKGQVLVAEVFSQRLMDGHTNPFLRLEKSGAHLAEAYGLEVNAGSVRLSTLHNDPVLKFEVKEDGVHTLLVSDLSNAVRSGRGEAFALQVRAEEPDFRLVAATEPPPETAADRAVAPRGAVLRAGGTTALRVVALKAGGFNEAIRLSAQDLPPGVSCEPTWIAAGKTEGVLILRADAGIGKAVALVRVQGTSQSGALVRFARGAGARWPVADYNTDTPSARLSRGDGVVVATSASAAPLALLPQTGAVVEAAAGGKIEVPLKVSRSADFKDVLKIKSGGASGLEALKEIDADAKSEVVKIPLDLAAIKLPEGLHSVYFTTQAKAKVAGRDVVTTVYSPVVQIQVSAAAKAAEVKSPAEPAPAK
jgi:hypothetical protein